MTKCSICYEKLRWYHYQYKTQCNHKYHLNCAKKLFYFYADKKCPICRQEVKWENPDIFLRYAGY